MASLKAIIRAPALHLPDEYVPSVLPDQPEELLTAMPLYKDDSVSIKLIAIGDLNHFAERYHNADTGH